MPATDISYYEDRPHYNEQFGSQPMLYRQFAESLLSTLDGIIFPNGSRLLDVGSGGGFLVDAAQSMGFIAEGVEANKGLVEWCRSRGLQVRHGDVNLLTGEGQRYDVVVLSSVLEHVAAPAELLRSCSRVLTSDGVILVDQASFVGLLPSVFPWGWYAWQPGEHFWHFSPESLLALADQAGLGAVRITEGTLHHAWFAVGGPKAVVGRNSAAILARLGRITGRGDRFSAVLKPQCST